MEPIIETLRKITEGGNGQSNYYDDQPLELSELLERLEEGAGNLLNLDRYKFTEFFEERKGSYYRIDEAFPTFNTHIKRSNREIADLVGLYVFFDFGKPIYIGNSRSISQRLRQHFLGKSHYTSSLVYLMARTYWELTNEEGKEIYEEERKYLPHFEDNRDILQAHMRDNWEILILPMPDPYERYLSEVYYAMHFKTYWNNFDTH